MVKTKQCPLKSVSELVFSNEICGIESLLFQIKEPYGNGQVERHVFEGVCLELHDITLKQDLKTEELKLKDKLVLSVLIEGEQIIHFKEVKKDFIFESQESYILYSLESHSSISYYKNKRYRELRIVLGSCFLKKHKIDSELPLLESLGVNKTNFSIPISGKSREILAELSSNERKGLLKKLFIESKVLELLIVLMDSRNNSDESKNLNRTAGLLKKMHFVKHMVCTNLSEHNTIQQLSRSVGLNESILKKEFKRVFGKTIMQFTLSIRMKAAKKELKFSKKPIYEISEMVGYKNSTHFTAAFKKLEGLTPRKYRGLNPVN